MILSNIYRYIFISFRLNMCENFNFFFWYLIGLKFNIRNWWVQFLIQIYGVVLFHKRPRRVIRRMMKLARNISLMKTFFSLILAGKICKGVMTFLCDVVPLLLPTTLHLDCVNDGQNTMLWLCFFYKEYLGQLRSCDS